MSHGQATLQPLGGRRQRKKHRGRRRSVPQRTCVGCRSVNPKRAMVRIVRTSEGQVEIDPSGKKSGRGAYVCQARGCWEKALKRRSIDRALKTTLDDATTAALSAYAQTLPDSPEMLTPDSAEGEQ